MVPRSSCDSGSEEVQVKDGSGTIVTLAKIGQGSYSRADETDPLLSGFTDVTCVFPYTANVPVTPVYTFVLLSGDKVRDTRTISLDDLRTRGAPTLATYNVY
jgi:hypothetical protein